MAQHVDLLLQHRHDWGVLTKKPSCALGVKDIETLVQQVAKHLTILNVRAQLEDFAKGGYSIFTKWY